MGLLIAPDVKKVALDSNCFIQLIEGSVHIASLFELFQRIERGELKAVTSTLTITEVMAGPYKKNDLGLVEEYRSLLQHFPNLHIRPLDHTVADHAAQLRVQYGLKTPDSIQLSTAVLEDTDLFVTHDQDFKRVDFPLLLL